MDRHDFLKGCLTGACACAAWAVMPPDADAGQSASTDADRAKRELDAVRLRYARLVEILGRELDADAQRRVFRALGRECAQQFKHMTFERFQGDIVGFLAYAKGPSGWMTKADYDEKSGTITIVDRASRCTCPLVDQALTPGLQCECTLGWQEATYGAILGRPVRASLSESILRGSSRCVFTVEAQA